MHKLEFGNSYNANVIVVVEKGSDCDGSLDFLSGRNKCKKLEAGLLVVVELLLPPVIRNATGWLALLTG